MGLRHDLKMPTTENHNLLMEERLRRRLGSNRGAILFLLQEERNSRLYQELSDHVYENLEENSIHLQKIQGDNGEEYILANLLSPTSKTENSPKSLIITIDEKVSNSHVISPIKYWQLSELCLDPKVEKMNLEMQLENAI